MTNEPKLIDTKLYRDLKKKTADLDIKTQTLIVLMAFKYIQSLNGTINDHDYYTPDEVLSDCILPQSFLWSESPQGRMFWYLVNIGTDKRTTTDRNLLINLVEVYAS